MPVTRQSLALLALTITATGATAAESNLSLSGIFSDHMVLQREKPIKVSGKSTAGDTVKVSLNDASAEATAGSDGGWQVELPAQKAGGPYALTATDADETTTVKDILIGDIWVCSGQSNMDWMLQRSANPEKAISEASHDKIRLYKVKRDKALKPLDELTEPPSWSVCSPSTVPEFSAVGYYFGRELQQELDVPIGLIHSAWGGTRVEWWTPIAGLKEFDYIADELKEIEAGTSDEELVRRSREEMARWHDAVDAKDPGLDGETPAWAASQFDDTSWKTMMLPGMFSKNELEEYDGTVWFRRTFTLTEEQAKKPIRLTFCADDIDVTYVNGTQVGTDKNRAKNRTYQVPADAVKAGENVIAIRVLDVQGDGGICGKAEDMVVKVGRGANAESVSLAGEWNYSAGVSLADLPERPTPPANIRPTVLYNAMIHPLTDFPIRGVIWYQGESNARNYLTASYAQTLKNMITEWRKAWGQPDFPFLQVQLASYMDISPEPQESDWALLREAQTDVLTLEKTAMASAIDIGDEKDIHPTNKLDVGKRLALGALAIEYGKDVEYTGPTYKSHEISGDEIVITFTHADDLKTSGPELKGFSIAGADGKFTWADARIDGDKVILKSDKVTEPKAARYGWANYSTGNLYNGADLPANPFRTDRTQ